MSIQTLQESLQLSISDGNLVLRDVDPGSTEMTQLLGSILRVPELTLSGVSLTATEDRLVLAGTGEVLGIAGVQVRVTLADAADGLSIDVQATVPPEARLGPSALPWFSIDGLGLKASKGGPAQSARGSLSGTVNLDRVHVPIAVELPAEAGGWRVREAVEKVPVPRLSDLAQVVGDLSMDDLLPAEVQSLGEFSIADVDVMYDPEGKTVAYLSLSLTSSAVWEIVPGACSVGKLELSVRVSDPTDAAKRQITGALSGDLAIGDTVVPVAIRRPAETGEWSLGFAEGEGIPLPGLAELLSGLGMEEVAGSLPSGLGGIGGGTLSDLEIRLSPAEKSLSSVSASFASPNAWTLAEAGLVVEDVGIRLSVSHPADAARRAVTGEVSGGAVVAGTRIDLRAAKESSGDEWTLVGELAAGSSLSLSAAAAQLVGSGGLPAEVPDLTLSAATLRVVPATGALSFSARARGTWDLPVGVGGLALAELQIDLSRERATAGAASFTGAVRGSLALGNARFTTEYRVPDDFRFGAEIPSLNLSSLLHDLLGGDAVRGLPVPAEVLALELSDLTLTIAPTAGFLSLSGASELGECEVQVKRLDSGSWACQVGFAPPAAWSFSSLSPELGVLDGLRFSETALILSTADDRSLSLTTISAPDDLRIERGLNLFASLDLSGLGVDELLGLQALNVHAAIGGRPSDMVIEAAIDGEFRFADNVAFGDVQLRLRPSPTDLSLTLLGTVSAVLDGSRLDFVGGLKVQPRAATLQATMEGTWNEPFGTKGLAIADVALDLGVSFPPPLPTLGIAGTLQVGDFQGAAAVKFDSAMPSRSMVAVAFNRLYLMDVLRAFCDPAVVASIPAEIERTVLDIGMEDVKVYIVPQPTRIGELEFEQGFTLQGRMHFWGLDAFAYMNLDFASGLTVRGDVDEIRVDGIFLLTGSGDRPKASLDLVVAPIQVPTLSVAGAVQLFGLRSETRIEFSDRGFYFFTEGRIFDMFMASLEARGTDLKGGGDFYVRAAMRNDLLAYLRTEATRAIQAAADEATRSLTDAQRAVTGAQAEMDRLDSTIEEIRRTVKAERERDAARLRAAQGAVEGAQRDVNRINGDLDATRRTIQAERDRDAARLRDAQSAVAAAQARIRELDGQIDAARRTVMRERDRDAARLRSAQQAVQIAQNEVNRLQGQIDGAKRRIRQLQSEIASWKRWYDKKPWYDKSWAWTQLGYETGWRGTEIGAQYSYIGGVEAAKLTAIGVLEGAKQVLRGMEAAAASISIDADPRVAGLFVARDGAIGVLEGAKQALRGMEAAAAGIPIDADPRMIGLYAARDTALAVLEGVKQVLRGMEAAAVIIPIDADPRLAGLFVARDGTKGVLEGAKVALEGVKAAVGGLAKVGTFIVQYGLGGLLDVKAARFEGSLRGTSGGRVALSTELSFMGGAPQTVGFDFDFSNPLAGAEELARKLLPA